MRVLDTTTDEPTVVGAEHAGAAPAPPPGGWARVVPVEGLVAGLGVAVLVRGRQVAVVRDHAGDVHALDNRDPFTGANVLSRGLVEEVDGVATLASPLRKQRFVLATGACLDDPERAVVRHEAREQEGWVEVCLAASDVCDAADTSP